MNKNTRKHCDPGNIKLFIKKKKHRILFRIQYFKDNFVKSK